MTTVTNLNGKKLDFNAAVELMENEVRELLHGAQDWDSEQQFFTAYEKAHTDRYGEWELSKANPVW